MRHIATAIASVAPSSSTPWNQRIVLGIWAAKFLPFCAQYLPGYAISNIGFSIPYARGFLTLPHICFNTLQHSLMGPRGRSYIRDLQAKGRPLLVWTVNVDYCMRWSIDRGVDGVITDDPKRFQEIVGEWEAGKRELGRMTWRQWAFLVWLNIMVLVFGIVFRWKYGGRRLGEQVRKATAVAADGHR